MRGDGRAVIGIFSLLIVVGVGFAAALAGVLTCREDVGSSEQAPHLCASLGSDTGLWVPPIVGGVAVLLFLLSPARTKTVALISAVIAAAEGALLLMWALVSHGTINY